MQHSYLVISQGFGVFIARDVDFRLYPGLVMASQLQWFNVARGAAVTDSGDER